MDNVLIELYKENRGVIDFLQEKNIISIEAKQRLEIYSFVNDKLNEGLNKTTAYELAAEKFHKTEVWIRCIIYRLNKPCMN